MNTSARPDMNGSVVRAPIAPALDERSPELSADAIFRAHGAYVWRTLHRMGVAQADLADLLQDVFLVVHRRLRSFDGSARMTTWLFAIAARVVANHRRAATRRPTVTLLEEPAAPDDGPEHAIARAQARACLEAAIASLPPTHRAVLVMYELEGLSGEAIAAELALPPGTIRSRLHHARRRVAALLPPDLRPGD